MESSKNVSFTATISALLDDEYISKSYHLGTKLLALRQLHCKS